MENWSRKSSILYKTDLYAYILLCFQLVIPARNIKLKNFYLETRLILTS